MEKVVSELRVSSYEKTHTYVDGKVIEIKFTSKNESLTDKQIKKADFLLDRLLQRFTADEISIGNIIKILRTIFVDSDEKDLIVEIKGISIIVRVDYVEGILDYYYCQSFTYDYAGVNIPKDSLGNCTQVFNKIDLVLRGLENISGKIDFNKDEKMICMIFKYFFDEKPDFWLKENMDKTQLLIHMLKLFGIIVNSDWNFYGYDEPKYSIGLLVTMRDLALLGQIEIDTSELDEKTKMILGLIKVQFEKNGYSKEKFTNGMMNIIKSKDNQFNNRQDNQNERTLTMIKGITSELHKIMY